MTEKDALIADMERARATMRALLHDLEEVHRETQELYPTWTIKELLAHLTGWDDACIASLQAHIDNTAPPTPAAIGLDPFNVISLHEREALSLADVTAEWETKRSTFLALIRDMPDSKVNQPFVFPWGPRGTLRDMVDVFAHHEIEHAEEIRQKHLGRSATP